MTEILEAEAQTSDVETWKKRRRWPNIKGKEKEVELDEGNVEYVGSSSGESSSDDNDNDVEISNVEVSLNNKFIPNIWSKLILLPARQLAAIKNSSSWPETSIKGHSKKVET